MSDRWTKRAFQAAAGTTFLVLIGLTVFLFREGLPALWRSPYADLRFAVHPTNPIQSLDTQAARALLQGKSSWAELGGPNAPVVAVHLANMERYIAPTATEVQIRAAIDSLAQFPGVFLALPPTLLPAHVRLVEIPWRPWRELFLSLRWSPTYEPIPSVSIWPLVVGSLWVSLIGLALVIPLGIAMAIYAAEILPRRLYYPLKILWELLAGLPSVVVGFWGLVVLVPAIQELFQLNAGETAFTAGLLLGWMTLPLMASLIEEALQAIPRLLPESSYGLGATQWQTILRLKLPYIRTSLLTAGLLSAGRILGETMVVLMVSGNSPLLSWSPLQPARTLPATLAAELGEAPVGSYHYQVLFLLGAILLLLTLSLNLTAYFIRPRHATT